jgi:hypothetical protein
MDVVADFVMQEMVSLLCLQEAKLAVIDDAMISNMLGSCFEYYFLLATGTRGGILVSWHTDKWSCSHVHLLDHVVTVKVTHCASSDPWSLTTVYMPQDDHKKVAFLHELHQLRAGGLGPWMLYRDFHFIYKAAG